LTTHCNSFVIVLPLCASRWVSLYLGLAYFSVSFVETHKCPYAEVLINDRVAVKNAMNESLSCRLL